MTITDLLTQTRAQYNATADTFFNDSEIVQYYYEACLEMSREGLLIEALNSSTSTVVGTQAYTVPTNAIILKRVTYDGHKLQPIDFRDDDKLTYLNQNSTAQGTPTSYVVWNRQVYLRPIPDDIKTLAFFTYNQPAALTSLSTLEIPEQFHPDLIQYALSRMYFKDKDMASGNNYAAIWNKKVIEAKKWAKKMKRGDSFAAVKDVEGAFETYLGYL